METLYCGVGKALLTPPLGTELAGYGYYLKRRAARVADDLYVRAVAFAQGGVRYCLVSCDVLGLSAPVAGACRAYLQKAHDCAQGHAMLVSIHTHTGPAIKHHEGTGEVDEDYLVGVAPAICRACDEAFANLAPVTGLFASMRPAPEAMAYNRTGTTQPDHQVRALRLTREGRPPVQLVSYACHAVARGRTDGVSADYPGQVCALLAQKGIEGIFCNGACGDFDPTPPHGADLAERMAGAIAAAADDPGQALPLTVAGGLLRETLHLMPVTAQDIRAAARHAAQNETIPGGAMVARKWEQSMLARLDTLRAEEPFAVRWLRLGGVPIVALPFETFDRTAVLLREAAGDPRCIVLGCADELLGYLPVREEFDRGTYAALESTFLYKRLPPLPGEAERIGRALGQALQEGAPHGRGHHEDDRPTEHP